MSRPYNYVYLSDGILDSVSGDAHLLNAGLTLGMVCIVEKEIKSVTTAVSNTTDYVIKQLRNFCAKNLHFQGSPYKLIFRTDDLGILFLSCDQRKTFLKYYIYIICLLIFKVLKYFRISHGD